ncbi:MAG TPA: SRPBCC family protein [Polyangiaceae bacterium]|nr:SRPBCC family protein [Polyangiaceae bacterium]
MTLTAPMTSLPAPARGRDWLTARDAPKNVHRYERAASLAVGGALAIYGLLRRGPLGLALIALGGGLGLRGARGVCPLYGALGVSTAGSAGPTFVERTVLVQAPAETMYELLRDPAELSTLFGGVLRVDRSEGRYRWALRLPRLGELGFDMNLIEEMPGKVMTWRTRSGGVADASIGARVLPAPGGQGTELTLTLRYDGGAVGPEGALGRLLAGGAKELLGEALRRLRQRAEAGELPTTAGQPSGRRTPLLRAFS